MMRTAVWIGAVTALAVTLLLAFDLPYPLELPLRDFVVRSLPAKPPAATVVIAIDERSLSEFGPWPWRREVLARLVDRAAEARAKAVVFDVLLADPRPGGDEILARSMQRIPTIAVAVLVEREQWLVPTPVLKNAAVIAHGNFELDHDGILRRFATTKQSGERAYTALSLEAASVLRPGAIPVGRTVAPMFRTPPRAIQQIGAADVLHGVTEPLRDRLVFIGPTALGLGDRVLTPVSATLAPDPGVTVHAAATESLLRDERVRALPPIGAGLVAGMAVGAIVRMRRRSRRARLTLVAAALALILGGGAALLALTGIAVPLATLALSATIATVFVEAQVMSQSTVRLEEIATRLAEQRAQEIESKRVLAHELKTPLASMRGLTQLLAGFDLNDAERRRVASLLGAEADKLQSMVGALLDLERLPLRDFQASTAVTDLGELVSARVDLLRAGTDRPVTASAERAVLVRADAMLIERVVDNLVGNALKYTGGAVRVSVQRRDAHAIVEVADRGAGIPPAERERLFQRFFRGASAAGTEGLGLGLALVAEVARWHGGRVAIDTGAEGGSVFRFILPLAES